MSKLLTTAILTGTLLLSSGMAQADTETLTGSKEGNTLMGKLFACELWLFSKEYTDQAEALKMARYDEIDNAKTNYLGTFEYKKGMLQIQVKLKTDKKTQQSCIKAGNMMLTKIMEM